jgi:Uma2 family endonuclease
MGQVITDIKDLDMEGTYTVADYLNWQFDELVQLIKGKIVRMSPAPLSEHGRLSIDIVVDIGNQIKNKYPKKYAIRSAPFDVYLPLVNKKTQEENTVVQPDVFIVTDTKNIKRRGYYGAPEWVCEILSKGTLKLDTVTKRELYAEAGVREYFIIYPEEAAIQVFTLQADGIYGQPEVYDKPGQLIELTSVPGLVLEVDTLFGPDATLPEDE